jgi:hypothetical protein
VLKNLDEDIRSVVDGAEGKDGGWMLSDVGSEEEDEDLDGGIGSVLVAEFEETKGKVQLYQHVDFIREVGISEHRTGGTSLRCEVLKRDVRVSRASNEERKEEVELLGRLVERYDRGLRRTRL